MLATRERPGSVRVRIAASPHAESALIADALRRAHLVDGVPWSQMAVIVRSVPRAGATLSRALAAAGVPVDLPSATRPLADQPAVRALLTVLDVTAHGLDGEQALALLTGPIGRVDPVSLRQLRRALRRADGSQPPREFADLLVGGARHGMSDGLPADQARPLRRVRAVLAAARRSADDAARSALHAVAGLAAFWPAAALAGGQRTRRPRRSAGRPRPRRRHGTVRRRRAVRDAHRRGVAARSRRPRRGMGAPAAPRDPRPAPDAVAVLSAHAALGREWEFVVIAGTAGRVVAQHHSARRRARHPAARRRAGRGRRRCVVARAPLLAEERRLLIAAMGRARTRLLVTAVDSDSGDDAMLPSPFCYELARLATDPDTDVDTPISAPRVLAPAALVGRLRAVVCAPPGAVDDAVRACAAAQLARLAAAGVPGADPAQWYGMTPLSTDEPLWSGEDQVVTLSPSTLQTLADCPLRWLLERHGGTDGRDVRSAVGSLLHALVADPAKTESQMLAELERLWEKLPFDSEWYADNELQPAPGDAVDVRPVARADPPRADGGGHRDRRRRRGRTERRRGARRAGARPPRPARTRRRRAGWWSSTSRPARARSPRTTRSATPSWRCTSWPSRKGCSRRVIRPVVAAWSISARPAPAVRPSVNRTR